MKRLKQVRLKGKARIVLWLLLTVITLFLFLSSSLPTPEISPLFGTLYYLWLSLLFLLLFTANKSNRKQETLLLGIFTLVFLCFPIFLRHGYGGDFCTTAIDLKLLGEENRVPMSELWYGRNFPGLSFLCSFVNQITSLSVFDTIYIQLLFTNLLLALLLYGIFKSLLKQPLIAALAVILAIQGNIIFSLELSTFHPRGLAILLLTAFLVVFVKDSCFQEWQNQVIAIFLVLALTFTHFVTSVFLFLLILTIYLLQKCGKQSLLSLSFVLLCLIFPLSWEIYQAYSQFETLVGFFPKVVEDFAQGRILVKWLLPLETSAYAPSRFPLWLNVSRWFWVTLNISLGFILGLRSLVRVKKLNPADIKVVGGVVAVALFSLLTLLLVGIEDSLNRGLFYATIFTAPLILGFISKGKVIFRKFGLILLILSLFILSFPTFLSYNWLTDEASYYHRISGGKFLESICRGSEEKLWFFGLYGAKDFINYYVPKAHDARLFYPSFRSKNENDIWQMEFEIIEDFKKPNSMKKLKLLEFSPEWGVPFKRFLGIDPTIHPQWDQLKMKLAESDKIYSNRIVQFYKAK